MERLGAVILCGGRSRRMGRPKEWMPIGEETFLQRMVRLVSTRTPLVVVAAAKGQELPALPAEVERVFDLEPDRGPLQGFAVGMQALASRSTWAFACATDCPLLRPEWIDRLLACTSDKMDLILPHVEGHDQPLAALYRPEVAAEAAAELLATGQTPLRLIRNQLRTHTVEAEILADVDPDFLTVRNINTQSDYEILIELLSDPEMNPIRKSRD
ncbi:molybdenum cofactor guanylyltransferase [Tautonia rosea]|uniref:molybdenum cofactor guanylyltransferase n=1 Tax=Tautonia rosea TaxID=2728037 RepID=UPI0014745B09|nr:molybdenum cofactor guanylyltransferase [Tautonia rosea]